MLINNVLEFHDNKLGLQCLLLLLIVLKRKERIPSLVSSTISPFFQMISGGVCPLMKESDTLHSMVKSELSSTVADMGLTPTAGLLLMTSCVVCVLLTSPSLISLQPRDPEESNIFCTRQKCICSKKRRLCNSKQYVIIQPSAYGFSLQYR